MQGPKFLQRSGLQRNDPERVRRGQGGAKVSDPWGLMGGVYAFHLGPYDFLALKAPAWFSMMQRSKRRYAARATTLFGTVLVHALIIYAILTNATKVFTSIPTRPTITVFSEPPRRPVDWNLPPVKWVRRPPVWPKAMLVLPTVDIPAESPLRDESSSSPTALSEVSSGVSKEDTVVPNAPGASVGVADKT